MFIFLFLVLVRWNESRISFFTPGVWGYHSHLLRVRCHNLVCVECSQMIKWMVGGWFLFSWGLMLLWVMSVGSENTCTVPGRWNVFRVILRLYGWVYENLRLNPLVVEHRVVIMMTCSHVNSNGLVVKVLDSQSRGPMFKTTGWLQGWLSLSSIWGW